mgnify:CR=1 FL=1
MTPVDIFALYAGLMALMLVVIIVRIIKIRRRLKVVYGDGNEPALAKAMRGHANFVETTSFGLIVLAALAMMGAPVGVMHVIGALLFIGRILHAWKFLTDGAPVAARKFGMLFTLASLIVGAGYLIIGAVFL